MKSLTRLALFLLCLIGLVVMADHASGLTREVIGHSVLKRPIVSWQQGAADPRLKVLVVGAIHGDELEGTRVVAQLRKRLALKRRSDEVGYWTVKSMNPDGVASRSRRNTRRVDLNRNFPFRWDRRLTGGYNSGPRPASEPETRAIMKLQRREKFDLAIWYHQPWGRTLVPCNRDRSLARFYARISRLGGGRGCDRGYYPGSATSWQHNRFGTVAFVVEFGPGNQPAAVVKRHAGAVLGTAQKLARR